MKTMFVFIVAVVNLLYFTGCENKGRYIDLKTGKTISLEKDPTAGYMVNADTKNPVEIYVDTQTHDTIYGRTGKVINNQVKRHPDGTFTYQGDDDYKIKVQEDGDIKIKDGDTKVKIDDGEKKVKSE